MVERQDGRSLRSPRLREREESPNTQPAQLSIADRNGKNPAVQGLKVARAKVAGNSRRPLLSGRGANRDAPRHEPRRILQCFDVAGPALRVTWEVKRAPLWQHRGLPNPYPGARANSALVLRKRYLAEERGSLEAALQEAVQTNDHRLKHTR
jgi:hypothetical protein